MAKHSYFLIFLIFLGCQTGSKLQSVNFDDQLFEKQVGLKEISDLRIMEASGMDAAHLNPGYFWTHNDSGDTARIFLIDSAGNIEATVFFESLSNRDWEEIVTVQDSTGSWIYVAEIGDNRAIYPSLMIHRFPEPIMASDSITLIAAEQIVTMNFTFPNGARDAETLFYDYNTGKMVLVTKREQACFVFAFDFMEGQGLVLPEPFGTLPSRNFVAADMRPNGELLLKTYDDIYYWPASSEAASTRILKGFQFRIPYKHEPQGESICWDEQGNFYTITERVKEKPQQLMYFQRKN